MIVCNLCKEPINSAELPAEDREQSQNRVAIVKQLIAPLAVPYFNRLLEDADVCRSCCTQINTGAQEGARKVFLTIVEASIKQERS